MKLRLRSEETKETLRIETPNPCPLSELKLIVSQSIQGSPPPPSIRLSLNRKDELVSDGEDQTLESLGIASGDLIFFSVVEIAPQIAVDAENMQNLVPHTAILSSPVPGSSSVEPMDVEEPEGADTIPSGDSTSKCERSRFSVPGFLRKVFLESIDEEISQSHKLLIAVAVHAAMLELGLVPWDEEARVLADGHRLFHGWHRPVGVAKSLTYKIPESIGRTAAVLKFHSFGRVMVVYGTLKGVDESKKIDTFRVQFDSDRLAPVMKDVREGILGNHFELGVNLVEKELFSFWRSVKDNLALPLLTGLCDECNMVSPSSLMRLPVDVILKILDFLPGVDLAKVSCTCSELKYLGSMENLWLSKIERELGHEGIINNKNQSSKEAFAAVWERKKRQRRGFRIFQPPYLSPTIIGGEYDRSGFPPFNLNPSPLMIGGEYDLSPSLFPGGGGRRRSSFRLIFSPRCDLGSPSPGLL